MNNSWPKRRGGGGGVTVSHKNSTLLISWHINIFWSTHFNSNFYSSLDISTYFDQHNLIAIFAKKWWFFIVFMIQEPDILVFMIYEPDILVFMIYEPDILVFMIQEPDILVFMIQEQKYLLRCLGQFFVK